MKLEESVWQEKKKRLEKEMAGFERVWKRIKPCRCKNVDCKHHKYLAKYLFNDRLNKLLVDGLAIEMIKDAFGFRCIKKNELKNRRKGNE